MMALFYVVAFLLANGVLAHADHRVGDMILTDDQYDRYKQQARPNLHIVGDMILTDDQFKHLPPSQLNMVKDTNTSREEKEGRQERDKRNAIKDRDYRWPNGVIPYRIDDSFSRRDKRALNFAMRTWSKYTCVKFTEAERKHKNRILIRNGDGCSSFVGMQGDRQILFLQKFGCRDPPTIMHELGHAIGLYHTQTRPDRNEHINIDLSKVDEINHYNFEKKTWREIHHFGVKYDLYSIMHYGRHDFGDGTGNVIATKDKSFQKIIGKAKTLSFGDIEMVNKMYKCKPRKCKLKDSDCPDVSFVGALCECLCPGPGKNQLVQPCGNIQSANTPSGDELTQEVTTSQMTTEADELV